MFFQNLKSKTDEELMNLIRKGEDRAFTELYNRYSKLLLRYFFRMLWKDENKAQDFLHDLFMKIIDRPDSFDSARKFSTWIYSVAHNMCKNEYRKHSFRLAANAEMPKVSVVDMKVDESLDQQTFMRLLDSALLQWAEEDRSLFTLRHELQMTFPEIALVLDCPEGTVKSRWFYLRKNLAEQLQEFQTLIR